VAFLISFTFLHLKEQYALPPEWYCQLAPGQTIERRLKIPQPIARSIASRLPQKQNWAAVLIDGNDEIAKSTVKINGIQIEEKPELLIPTVDKEVEEPSESAIVYEAARAAGVPLSKLRQWRFVRVPLSAINLNNADNAFNTISLTAGDNAEGSLVFGQYRLKAQEKQQMTPALWGFSLGKWSTDGDMRVTDKSIRRIVQQPQCKPPEKQDSNIQNTSQFKDSQDLSPAAGEQSGEYRLYLVLGKKPATDEQKVSPDVKPELNMQFKKSLKIIL